MSRYRCFCSFSLDAAKAVLNDVDEINHLFKVLRLQPGDKVELVNGCGALALARILHISKSSVEFSFDETFQEQPSTSGLITLACAIPKRTKFELIIEKCTELGVNRIIPLLTERTEVVLDNERVEKKHERYLRISISALKQSKRLWLPEISNQVEIGAFLKNLSTVNTHVFIPWLQGPRIPMMRALDQCKTGKEFVFLIGPEGDFTPDEVEQAKRAGAIPLSLGETTLKVDTAACLVVGLTRAFIFNSDQNTFINALQNPLNSHPFKQPSVSRMFEENEDSGDP
ncbi:MAG: RsmE family RNA methyltransferase [Candidatus Omnitrophota bacterium]